jgi:hypothetical protein
MNPKKRKKLAIIAAKQEVAAVVETVPEVKVELKVEEAKPVVVESAEEVVAEAVAPVPAIKKTKKTV